MAKKSELIEQARKLGLEVIEKNTVAEIEDAIKSAQEFSAEEKSEQKVAKAGKRSAKAIKEAEEKAAKDERKEKIASGEEVVLKKGPKPITRSKLERRSNKYKEVQKLIDPDKNYTVKDAVGLLPKLSTSKFEGSAELHIKLGVDPKHADQNIRGTVILPHGTGKTKTIAVFAPADLHKAAKDAGADIVGEETLLEQLDKETVNFEVLISTPQLMAKLSKYARLLGPKGLMPNPKTGTVASDVSKAVKEAKAGKVEYRVDKQGIVHLGVGKLSFTSEKLVENAQTVIKAVKESKPAGIKGEYIQTVTLAPTMGPGVKLEK
ncbi:MAG: 50S ribosomal protein L1 [Candidatus Nomurabacteria bacterium]|nr:MAG: 50S ribosomal protein L1 [Candidatus Nomurabacteria bacterium]HRV76094.1 50S ribosomal protein L1 [Candidatus Saccharimonadales bacterium]